MEEEQDQQQLRHPHPDLVTTSAMISPSLVYHSGRDNDDDGEVSRSIRSVPPADFALHIKTIRMLPKMLEKLGHVQDMKYKSGVFQSGGYQWRLYLYPEGDRAKGGSGFISLYLAIAETSNLPLDWEVNVNFKLLIHDQLRDTYLTIQERHGKIRRFHSMKREHGFTKLITLDDFHNPSKGYVVGEDCTFGAEIHVRPRTTRVQIINMLSYCPVASEVPHDHLSWALPHFSKKGTGCYSSHVMDAQHRKWKFHVYPKGHKMRTGRLSLYLEQVDRVERASRFNFMRLFDQKYGRGGLFAIINIRVKDQTSGRHLVTKVELSRSRYSTYGDFALSDIVNSSERFLVNDTLIVEAIFTLTDEIECI